MKHYGLPLTLIVAVFLAAVVTACEPTITGQGRIDTYHHIPYCPTTDSAFWAADSVPLGCVVPDSGLGIRAQLFDN